MDTIVAESTPTSKPAAAFSCSKCGKCYGSPRNLQRHVCKATKNTSKAVVDNTIPVNDNGSPQVGDGWALIDKTAISPGCSSPLSSSSPNLTVAAVNKCERCDRILCSQRSLKRHRVTCKVGVVHKDSEASTLGALPPSMQQQSVYPLQQKAHRPVFSKQREDAIAKVANVVDSVVEKLRLQKHTTVTAQPIYNTHQTVPLSTTVSHDHQMPIANQPPPSTVNHQQLSTVNQVPTVNHFPRKATVNQPSTAVNQPQQPTIVNHEHQQLSTVNNQHHAQQPYGSRVYGAPPQYPLGWTHTHATPPPPATVSMPVQPPPPGVNQPQKNVYRHLCPECDKPYSCRKNVKRHRVSVHKVSMEEAQNGAIKKVKLTEAEVLALGVQQCMGGGDSKTTTAPLYGTANSCPTSTDNNHHQQQHPIESNSISKQYSRTVYPAHQYPTYHHYNEHPQQAPFSAPPTFSSSNHPHSTPFSWGDHNARYMSPNKKAYPPAPPAAHMYTAYGCQYYEYAGGYPSQQNPQIVAPQHRHSFDATTNTTPNSNTYNNNWADLDFWDQIKSNVDGPLVSRSRDDDLEMARIAEDLKRSAEGEMGLNQQTALLETNDLNMALVAKKPVELVLAEADSTFWEEELEGLTARTTETYEGVQKKPQKIFSPPHLMNNALLRRLPDQMSTLSELDIKARQFIQSKAVALLSPISATINEPMEKKMRLSPQPTPQPTGLTVASAAEPKDFLQLNAGGVKRRLKRPGKTASEHQTSPPLGSERAPVGSGCFLCNACNRNLSTEYSLKRHKQICQKYKDNRNGHTKTQLKLVPANGLANCDPSDPDSTTTFCQSVVWWTFDGQHTKFLDNPSLSVIRHLSLVPMGDRISAVDCTKDIKDSKSRPNHNLPIPLKAINDTDLANKAVKLEECKK